MLLLLLLLLQLFLVVLLLLLLLLSLLLLLLRLLQTLGPDIESAIYERFRNVIRAACPHVRFFLFISHMRFSLFWEWTSCPDGFVKLIRVVHRTPFT